MLVIVLVSVMILIMVLGRRRPAIVLRALSPIERLVNSVLVRFKKKPLNPWAGKLVTSFSDAAGLIGQNPRPTLEAYGCSIIASLCELSCFCLVGLAFGVTSIEPLVCGYVVATLFAMISITPQGVGVVEAMVVVAFTAFGESSAAGMAIGLVYRGIVFWMPFIIGAILINVTKTFRGEVEKPAAEAEPAAEAQGASPKRHLRLPQYDIPTLSQEKVVPLKTEIIEERSASDEDPA